MERRVRACGKMVKWQSRVRRANLWTCLRRWKNRSPRRSLQNNRRSLLYGLRVHRARVRFQKYVLLTLLMECLLRVHCRGSGLPLRRRQRSAKHRKRPQKSRAALCDTLWLPTETLFPTTRTSLLQHLTQSSLLHCVCKAKHLCPRTSDLRSLGHRAIAHVNVRACRHPHQLYPRSPTTLMNLETI